MLRNVITLGLQRISPQVLNVITAVDKTVNVPTSINAILGRFRLNIGAMQKQEVSHILSVCL